MAQAVAIDEPAPDFTLADQAGQAFTLSRLKGEKHVLLVFNRGFL